MSTRTCARRGLFTPDGAHQKPTFPHFLQRHKSPLPTRAHTPPVYTAGFQPLSPPHPRRLSGGLFSLHSSPGLFVGLTHTPHVLTHVHICTHAHTHTLLLDISMEIKDVHTNQASQPKHYKISTTKHPTEHNFCEAENGHGPTTAVSGIKRPP